MKARIFAAVGRGPNGPGDGGARHDPPAEPPKHDDCGHKPDSKCDGDQIVVSELPVGHPRCPAGGVAIVIVRNSEHVKEFGEDRERERFVSATAPTASPDRLARLDRLAIMVSPVSPANPARTWASRAIPASPACLVILVSPASPASPDRRAGCVSPRRVSALILPNRLGSCLPDGGRVRVRINRGTQVGACVARTQRAVFRARAGAAPMRRLPDHGHGAGWPATGETHMDRPRRTGSKSSRSATRAPARRGRRIRTA